MIKRFGNKRSPQDGNDSGQSAAQKAQSREEADEMATRDALEEKVRDKDAHISDLARKRSEKERVLEVLKSELEEEKLKQMQNEILHKLEKDRLERQTLAMEERLQALERDMQDKEVIQEYASLIKSVAPENGVDSQYVMKLQAQLAKAINKMDATTQQMALVEESCTEVLESLKAEITEVVEERCRNEFELRKQLQLLKEQKVDMQTNYEQQIRNNQEGMEKLRLRSDDEEMAEHIRGQMEETETRLEELNLVNNDQDSSIAQLNRPLENMNTHSTDDKLENEEDTTLTTEKGDTEEADEDGIEYV